MFLEVAKQVDDCQPMLLLHGSPLRIQTGGVVTMTETHNTKRLRAIRKAAGLSQEDLGAAMNPPRSKQQVSKWESGKNRVTPDIAREIAAIVGCNAAEIVDPDFIWEKTENNSPPKITVTLLPVRGTAQAGYWAEPDFRDVSFDLDTGEQQGDVVPIAPVKRFNAAKQYCLEIVGNSINRQSPPGSYAACVELSEYPGGNEPAALDGLFVHVERNRNGLIETTIKRFVAGARGAAHSLMPDSDDPKHQEPVSFDMDSGDGHIAIVGIVLGFFKLAI